MDRVHRLKVWLLLMCYACGIMIATYSIALGMVFVVVADTIIRDKIFP